MRRGIQALPAIWLAAYSPLAHRAVNMIFDSLPLSLSFGFIAGASGHREDGHDMRLAQIGGAWAERCRG